MWGPIRATSFLDVLWFLKDLPSTIAPLAYLSVVARVTKAWSALNTKTPNTIITYEFQYI